MALRQLQRRSHVYASRYKEMTPTQLFRDCYKYELTDDLFSRVDWSEIAVSTAKEHAVSRVLDGTSSTSLDQETHTYRLLDGKVVQAKLKWLRELYLDRFRELAEQAFSKKIQIDTDVLSQVNVNFLDSPQHSYDWHCDTNHCTGLLFLNSLREQDGGELLFEVDGERHAIRPCRGALLFFDARDKPHTIAPIKAGVFRATAVMNYYFEGEQVKRPDDLNEFLYS